VTESAAENPIFEVSKMTMVAGIKGRATILTFKENSNSGLWPEVIFAKVTKAFRVRLL
jgi:hypothetical protein